MIRNGSIRIKISYILMLFIGLFLIVSFIKSSFINNLDKEYIRIKYLNNNVKKTNDLLQDVIFDVVYGAPHFEHFKSFSYYKGKFEQDDSGKYIRTMQGSINYEELNALYGENVNLKLLEEKNGQLNFIKEVENFKFAIFDGWRFVTNDSTSLEYKIHIKDINNGQIKKIDLETEIGYVANNLHYYKNHIFLSGIETSFNNENNTYITSVVIYDIFNNSATKKIVGHFDKLVNERNFIMTKDYFVMTYLDEMDNEVLLVYNLVNNHISNKLDLGGIIEKKNINVKKILLFDDLLYCFYEDNNKIGVITITNNFKTVDYYNMDSSNYTKMNNIFTHNNNIYLLSSNESRQSCLFNYDFKINRLIKLVEFEIINDNDGLFIQDIFLYQ